MNFGNKIKELRTKMSLTQEELASRCDLSKGFISLVERDLTSPSIATLMDILECLGTDLKTFFSDTDNATVVFHKDNLVLQENEDMGYDLLWLIPNAQKNMMEPILLTIHGGGQSETYPPHEGEIFGYAMQGNVTLALGSMRHKIKKGESFYYKANSPHRLENAGKNDAQVLWVSAPPNF